MNSFFDDDFNQLAAQPTQGGFLDQLLANPDIQPSAGFPALPQDANAAMPAPAPQQPQNAPIAVGDYSMPRIGSGFDLPPGQLDPNTGEHVVPAAAPAPQPAAPSAMDGFGSHLMAGVQNFAHGGAIIPALVNGITGLATGQRTDPQGVAQQNTQTLSTALAGRGIPSDQAQQLSAIYAIDKEAGRALIEKALGPPQAAPQYAWDAKTGKAVKTYDTEAKDNFQVVQTGEDGQGNKTFSMMNKATGDRTPIAPAAGDTGNSGIGDTTKTGAEYLATLPPQIRGTVLAVAEGRQAPPTGFAASKPFWAKTIIPAVQQFDSSFDANNWAARHKMSTDMAGSSNSSMGGILSNGKSSFKHLAEYTDSAADLGNASHDYFGGGAAAYVQNYVGNKFGGSDTKAKIGAINDNLGKYGAESTKFYSGTGGGAEERTAALHNMDPNTASSEEAAAFAAKEKGLMLDRLHEKESQIRDTMGEAYLAKHPVFTPDLMNDIARIDANIAKMRGGAPTGGTAPTGVKWSVVQ